MKNQKYSQVIGPADLTFIRHVPDNFINVSAEWIVEVLWANSYINKTAYYYDEELIIVSRGCE